MDTDRPLRAARRLVSLWKFRAQRQADEARREVMRTERARARVRELEGGADRGERLELLEQLVTDATAYMRPFHGEPSVLTWLERAQEALLEIPQQRRYCVSNIPGRPLLRQILDRVTGTVFQVEHDRVRERLHSLTR